MSNTKAAALAKIIAMPVPIDDKRLYGMASTGIEMQQGQFVIACMMRPNDPEMRVGHIVQIRKRCGQFGSDKVFMRLHDGRLIAHENQGFWSMTDEQVQLTRAVFEPQHLPDVEDYSQGYLCCDKVHEVGFIVLDSKSPPSPDVHPMNMTIERADGSKDHIVII